MIYLLDVNALLAVGLREHEFHDRVSRWVAALPRADELATCPITELGFVRVLAQAPQYQISVAQGCSLLSRLKANRRRSVRFIADALSAEKLPAWVKGPRQTTDGHLLELAKAHVARLATLDEKIPGGFLIPSLRAAP